MSKSNIYKHLDRLGYPAACTGTDYIATAITICLADRDARMCKDIYPGIAAATGKSWASIERAMRTATDAAMRSPVWTAAWREIGGVNEPTNSEVCHRIAREIREEEYTL